jgi:uncharacterized protein (TIGR03437 family)
MTCALFLFLTFPLFAQFSGLATTDDGSQLYFSTSLQLKGTTSENLYRKIFRYDSSGLHFVAQADRVAIANGYPRLTNPYNLVSGYISGNGSVVGYVGYADCAGFQLCASTPGMGQTTLQYSGALFPTTLPYDCAITRNARYAACATVHSVNFTQYSVYDLFASIQNPIYKPICNEGGTGIPAILSSDGHFLCEDQLWSASGPTTLNIQGDLGGELLSDDGSRIVTISDSSLEIYDVATGAHSSLPFQAATQGSPVSLNKDGSVILLAIFKAGIWQLGVIHADGTGFLQLTNDPSGANSWVLSGDGSAAFAVTKGGQLLKIDTASGASALIASGAEIQQMEGGPVAGSLNTMLGIGLADATISASTFPLTTSLGGTETTVNGTPAPLLSVSPTSISFQIPWETPVGNASIAVVRAASPFMQAAAPLQIAAVQPEVAFNFPLSQNFQINPLASPGDIVSFYLTGLGPVTVPVADGAISPSSPLPLLVHPVTVSGGSTQLNVLYAGLAPGLVGIYQVTVQLPASFSNLPSLPFGFGLLLTLNSSVHLPPIGMSRIQ